MSTLWGEKKSEGWVCLHCPLTAFKQQGQMLFKNQGQTSAVKQQNLIGVTGSIAIGRKQTITLKLLLFFFFPWANTWLWHRFITSTDKPAQILLFCPVSGRHVSILKVLLDPHSLWGMGYQEKLLVSQKSCESAARLKAKKNPPAHSNCAEVLAIENGWSK